MKFSTLATRNTLASSALRIGLFGSALFCDLALAQATIPDGPVVVTPEEALEILSGDTPRPPQMIIDYGRDSLVQVFDGPQIPRRPAQDGAFPVVVEIDDSAQAPILEGDDAISSSTAMSLSYIRYQSGDGGDTNTELFASLHSISFDEAKILMDFAKTAMNNFESAQTEARNSTCAEYRNGVDNPGELLVNHFNQVAEMSNNYFLNVYLDLPNRLPAKLHNPLIAEINDREVRITETDALNILSRDTEKSHEFLANYCN